MTHMYFSARAEGRISYGHLGRTNSCFTGKSYFHNRKMPENSGSSLPDNKCKLYRQYNAYKSITDRLVRLLKKFKDVNSSKLTIAYHIHQHRLIRPMTTSTSAFHVGLLSARRRSIFHAAITFATRIERKTHEEYVELKQS